MQIFCFIGFCFTLMLQCSARAAFDSSVGGHHHEGHNHKGHHSGHHKGRHDHHKGHHGKHQSVSTKIGHHASQQLVDSSATTAKSTVPIVEAVAAAQSAKASKTSRDAQLVAKMKALELRLAKKKSQAAAIEKGHILVNGPISADFNERFSQSVAYATGIDAGKVAVVGTSAVADQPGVVAVEFKAPPKIVAAVEEQSADPDSKLATGNLHSFLVAKSEDGEAKQQGRRKTEEPEEPKLEERGKIMEPEEPAPLSEATPVQEKGIDIDTAMPYGDLEPFGREDTAQELTENSVTQSDEMVDQLERAEVAEEKRAVFRALTRLRGAAITSFDGVARSQTGNIDEYNKIHKWRKTHPLHHLADEESDVSKWAFPDNADF